ncbi:MAG: hypothetical protein U1A78_06810 [Polyangia bacterium]
MSGHAAEPAPGREQAAPERRAAPRWARGVLALIAALVLGYYLLTPQGLYGAKAQGDGFYSFHYLPSLAVFRTVDMRHALPHDLERMDTGPHGHKLNRAPIGPALAMLPLYCLGEGTKAVAVAALRGLGADPRMLGPEPFEPHTGQMLYTGLVSALGAILGMFVVHRLLRRHTSEVAATLGAAASVLATPVLWYATEQPHYQHALAFAATALFVERWDNGRRSGGPRSLAAARFVRLGLLGGLAMLMRPQELVFLVLPGLELLLVLVRALRHRDGRTVCKGLRAGLVLGAAAGLAFLPQLLVWAAYFGWLVRPFHIEPMRFTEPALLEVLFSMRAGLFPWTPLAYLGFAGLGLGLLRGPAATRALAMGALCVSAADVYVVASSWAWHGTFSFGARRLSDLAVFFGLGTALLLDRAAGARRGRRLLSSVVAAAVLGCVLFGGALVELWRRRVLPNSALQARPAALWVEKLGGPRWLVQALRLGNPLVQPAGWLFALRHHAPATAWESVDGSYLAERNEHDFALSGVDWSFVPPEASGLALIAAGGEPGPDGVTVRGELRLLLQPFAREPLELRLAGEFPDGDSDKTIEVRWDGEVLPVRREAGGLRVTLPAGRAHRVGELVLRGPARLVRLQVGATSRYWFQPRSR